MTVHLNADLREVCRRLATTFMSDCPHKGLLWRKRDGSLVRDQTPDCVQAECVDCFRVLVRES